MLPTSILRVLHEQGVTVAARTYRSWKHPNIATRTITDAMVMDTVRDTAWATTMVGGKQVRKLTPQGIVWAEKDDRCDPPSSPRRVPRRR